MAESSKSLVFKVGGGHGGGAEYAPTGYAAAYSQGKGIMEMMDWQDRKRRESLEEQYAQSRQERAMEAEKLAQERAEREQARLDLQARRQELSESRKMAREDQYAERMDNLDKIIGAINQIDPIHKDARGMLNDVRSSQEFHRLMANRDTRQALNDAWKEKTGEIKDVISGIQHEAKSKYGIDADLSQFPVDENGNWDFQKGYNEHLPSIAKQMQQRSQQAYEAAQAPEGKVKYAEYDEYGRMSPKYATPPKPKQLTQQQIIKSSGLSPYHFVLPELQSEPEEGQSGRVRGDYVEQKDASGKAVKQFVPNPKGSIMKIYDRSSSMFPKEPEIPSAVYDEAAQKLKQADVGEEDTPGQAGATPEAATGSSEEEMALTKAALMNLAKELGPNATKKSLMDLARKRGYKF